MAWWTKRNPIALLPVPTKKIPAPECSQQKSRYHQAGRLRKERSKQPCLLLEWLSTRGSGGQLFV